MGINNREHKVQPGELILQIRTHYSFLSIYPVISFHPTSWQWEFVYIQTDETTDDRYMSKDKLPTFQDALTDFQKFYSEYYKQFNHDEQFFNAISMMKN